MTRFLLPASLWWDGRRRPGAALRIGDDGSIAAVPFADVPADAIRRELPGTLLPGLTDAHVHSALADLATIRAGGIAGVWDLGGVPEKVTRLARRSAAQAAARHDRPRPFPPPPLLPKIRYAGPFLIAPGGYPSDRVWAPAGSWRELRSVGDAAGAVGEAHAGGATLIKVTAHAGGPLLPPATMAAVTEAAHALGLPVVVHAEGQGTVAGALECGADLLAHTPWTEPLDPGLVRACAAAQQWISTLDIHGWGTATPARVTAVGNLRRFLEDGGTVRYGTDLGNGPLPPAVNPREVRALQDAGLPPDAVLAAMTEPSLTGSDISWVPGGLDLEPSRFADSLATVRVLEVS